MGVRFWHHLFMWFFVAFIIVHIYLSFYHDYIEGRGTVSLDRRRMEVRQGESEAEKGQLGNSSEAGRHAADLLSGAIFPSSRQEASLANAHRRRWCSAWATSSWAMRASAFTWCARLRKQHAARRRGVPGRRHRRLHPAGAAGKRRPHHPHRRRRGRESHRHRDPHDAAFSKDYPPTLTAHDIGVKDLLDVFYMQGGHARGDSLRHHHRSQAADFDGVVSGMRQGRGDCNIRHSRLN